MRQDRDRLLDILDAIQRIGQRIPAHDQTFFKDELLQVWAIHHIQIIGEAAAGVSQETRERLPDIPWPAIVVMRNVIVHHYFGIDMQQIWDTIQNDLPCL